MSISARSPPNRWRDAGNVEHQVAIGDLVGKNGDDGGDIGVPVGQTFEHRPEKVVIGLAGDQSPGRWRGHR